MTEDELKANIDAALYGCGFMQNGKHVPIDDIYVDPRDARIEALEAKLAPSPDVDVDKDYELASRMIGAYEDFISGHRVERIRLAADILKRTRPAPYEPCWDNPDGPEAA